MVILSALDGAERYQDSSAEAAGGVAGSAGNSCPWANVAAIVAAADRVAAIAKLNREVFIMVAQSPAKNAV